MKVVMLCDFYGKEQTYQENYLSKYYNKNGNECVIIASTNENIFDYVNNLYDKSLPSKIDVDQYGSTIYRQSYKFNIKGKIMKFSGVFEILLQEKPDLIYVHSIHFNLNDAVKYKKMHPHCKIIMDFHMDHTNSGKNWFSINILHKIIRKTYLNKYKKYISNFYPVTPGTLDFINEIYGIPKAKMEVLPLGCDSEISNSIFTSLDRNEERKKLNFSPDDLIILTGGKLNEIKRTDLAILAFKKAKIKNAHLIIFGKTNDEKYKSFLDSIIEGDPNIHFMGWMNTEESHKLMFISDLALFPSSQSVLWQQSIGMHLPLVVGDLGGQAIEYLNKHNNVIIVQTQDLNVNYFADILKELANDGEKLKLMKKGAAKTAEEFLDYEIIIKKTLK